MSRDEYTFAELRPEIVDEIRQAERKISALSGLPITLIAYQSEAEAQNPEHATTRPEE